MKQLFKCSKPSNKSRDGEFHGIFADIFLLIKGRIALLAMLLFTGYGSYAQPVLVSGFNGMAAVNGTAYTKTAIVGDPTGGYAFVAASNDRMKFFASSFSKHYLYFIDPATNNILDSMNHDFYHLSGYNDANTLFARTDAGLCRINTLTKTITDSVNIADAFNIAERPNSKEVWVGSKNKLVVVDYSSTLTAGTPFAYSNNTNDLGDIQFTKGGSMAYKMAWTSNKVYKINATTKAILDSALLGTGGNCLVVSADSSKIYVTFPSTKKIKIYQTSNMAIVDSIDCGTREPFEIYRHPDRAEIWIVNHFKDSITVLNAATHAQIAAFGVSSSPHSIAFATGSTTIKNTTTQVPEIKAYPNPVSNNITVANVSTGQHILMYDPTGRLIFTIEATSTQQTFDISALMPGTYLIQVFDENHQRKANIPIMKL